MSECDPNYSHSTGGALKLRIDHLPFISLDESVHDEGDDIEGIDPPRDEQHELDGGPTILQEPACIAYHMSLHQLVGRLTLPENECKKCGTPKPFDVRITSRGTAAIIEWVSYFLNILLCHLLWHWISFCRYFTYLHIIFLCFSALYTGSHSVEVVIPAICQ